jgi:hypothetical protein
MINLKTMNVSLGFSPPVTFTNTGVKHNSNNYNLRVIICVCNHA